MALNGSCFMITSTILKNHFLEVGLTQNRETMALRTFTTVDLLYFIMCEDQRESSLLKWHLAEDPITYGFEDPWPWFWRYLGTAFGHTLSFGLSQFHGHGSWLVSEVALNKWHRTLDCAKNHVQTVSSYLYFMSFNQIFHVVAGIEGFSSQIGWEPLVSTNIHQLHFC